MPDYSKPNPSALPDGLVKELLTRIQPPDTSDIAGLLGPLGAPVAMTRYATKAAREAAFNKTWPAALEKAQGPMKDALSYLTSKYPRIMSHVTKFKTDVPEGTPGLTPRSLGGQRQANWPDPKSQYFSEIIVDPEGIAKQRRQPLETIAHEVRHAIDQLRLGRKFDEQYELMMNKTGYELNPFEVAARKAGRTHTDRLITGRATNRLNAAGKTNATP